MTDTATRAAYPAWSAETLRYGDTDRQGHINNAVFVTLLETGRVDILYDRERPIIEAGTAFVIARLTLDFKAELNWPGEARIGTRVTKVGRSSVTFEQVIYQGDTCAAVSESIIVLMNEATRKSHPLPPAAVARFAELMGAHGS